MNTPSHLIVTAALDKALPRNSRPRTAVLLGALAPDVALWALSLGGILYYESILGWGRRDTFHHMFDNLYFNDPFWKAAHNLLQAPILLLAGLGICWLGRGRWPRPSNWFAWFLAACLLHSMMDVLTHHDDGPLILFPFDWSTRFASPVSYWDRRYHGAVFAKFELVLDVALLGYLVVPLIWKWVAGRGKLLGRLPDS